MSDLVISRAASSAPARRRSLGLLAVRARIRRLLVVDLSALDHIDLGDPADFDAETAEIFSRGGHRPAPRV